MQTAALDAQLERALAHCTDNHSLAMVMGLAHQGAVRAQHRLKKQPGRQWTPGDQQELERLVTEARSGLLWCRS